LFKAVATAQNIFSQLLVEVSLVAPSAEPKEAPMLLPPPQRQAGIMAAAAPCCFSCRDSGWLVVNLLTSVSQLEARWPESGLRQPIRAGGALGLGESLPWQ